MSIVGAPRCGTTSLSRWLAEHPDVCFSEPKEPHFFSWNDLRGLDKTKLAGIVRHHYLDKYFPDHRPGQMLGDGSVTYLYRGAQMEPVLQLWPDAKFIIGLRDPLELLPSIHQRLLYLCDEDQEDFNQAWELRKARAEGKAIPATCVEPRWLQYEDMVRLGKHVREFFDAVGRKRCLVVLFDDLKADPAGQYARVLDFLGLENDGRKDFAPHRPRHGYRYGWVQRAVMRPPIITGAVLASYKVDPEAELVVKPKGKLLAGIGRGIRAARTQVLKWNSVTPAPSSLAKDVRREICNVLSHDVAELSGLIGRDLGHWLDGEALEIASAA